MRIDVLVDVSVRKRSNANPTYYRYTPAAGPAPNPAPGEPGGIDALGGPGK